MASTTESPLIGGTTRRPALVLIVGLLLLRTVLLFLGDGITYGIVSASGADFGSALMYTNVTIVAVDILSVLAVIALLRRDGRTLGDLIGRVRVGVDAAWGLLVFVIAYLALIIGTFVGNLIIFQGPPPSSGAAFAPPMWLGLWSLIVMPATVAVAEELVYRGYAQEHLTARLGRVGGVLVVAAFFGLQHAALSATGWDDMAARVIGTFIAGTAFGLLRVWLKRLAPLIFGHWLLDVIGLGLPMMFAALA